MKRKLNINQLLEMETTWPADTVVEMILGAILIQTTTWHNTTLSLNRLREATNFNLQLLTKLTPEKLAPLIYSSGFHKHKAQLIVNYFSRLGTFGFDIEALKNRRV